MSDDYYDKLGELMEQYPFHRGKSGKPATPRTTDAGYEDVEAELRREALSWGKQVDRWNPELAAQSSPAWKRADALADMRRQRDKLYARVEAIEAELDDAREELGRLADQLGRYSFKDRAERAEAQLTEARAERDRYKAQREMIANRSREIAGHYPQSSDGRNTFVMFADWIEALPAPSLPEEPTNKELSP